MSYQDPTTAINGVVEGGVAATTVALLHQTALSMIPYLIPAIPLIVLDLHFGIKAAKHRYKKYKKEADRVTFSRALRGTVGKVFEFACWLILASSMSVAFEAEWIEWATLGVVYVNEIGSVIGNYLCTKNIEFSLLEFLKAVFVYVGRFVASKIGIIADDVTFDGVLKPMPDEKPRNKKGQYVKQGDAPKKKRERK